jgi:hypothetical protein
MDIKATHNELIEWIQELEDEELISELYYFKLSNPRVNRAEKKELNLWLSKLEYEPQLEALRSIIASSPDPDKIRNELSPKAWENIHRDDYIKENDLKYTPVEFWNLVWSLRESEKFTWDDLSEEQKETIERRMDDEETGRMIPHEQVMKECMQKINDRRMKKLLEEIEELPAEMKSRLADKILQLIDGNSFSSEID